MAVYNPLAGAGVQGLTPNVQRLIVEVQSYGPGYSTGRAAPQNYFHLGLLRLGVQGAYYPSVPIDGASILLDVPVGVTSLGYSLMPGTSIKVTEVFGVYAPFPAGGVHVAGLSTIGNIPDDGTTHTLIGYTVPAGRSALVEQLWIEVALLNASYSVSVYVQILGQYDYLNTFTGAPGNPAGGVYTPVLNVFPQLRLNAGESLVYSANVPASSPAVQTLANFVVLEYPQPMW